MKQKMALVLGGQRRKTPRWAAEGELIPCGHVDEPITQVENGYNFVGYIELNREQYLVTILESE
jgi:hypothetical protein